MAKEATFDIVSEVDMQEVSNAVNQATKEISQRYDFKGVKADIEIDNKSIKITAQDDTRLHSIIDILQSRLLKRGVPINNFEYGKVEPAAGGCVRQIVTIHTGIDKDLAKTISKDIKATKLKVQSQFMDDKVRVSAKKIDDLQTIIAMLKEKDYPLTLQFNNFRS
jgi:uncharacterized protein YajQ (UPF0234 family)